MRSLPDTKSGRARRGRVEASWRTLSNSEGERAAEQRDKWVSRGSARADNSTDLGCTVTTFPLASGC